MHATRLTTALTGAALLAALAAGCGDDSSGAASGTTAAAQATTAADGSAAPANPLQPPVDPNASRPVARPPVAADTVARRFIDGAVLRHDLSASYELLTVAARGRTDRATWLTGNIPVVPIVPRSARVRRYDVLSVYLNPQGTKLTTTYAVAGTRPGASGLILLGQGTVFMRRETGAWRVEAYLPVGVGIGTRTPN